MRVHLTGNTRPSNMCTQATRMAYSGCFVHGLRPATRALRESHTTSYFLRSETLTCHEASRPGRKCNIWMVCSAYSSNYRLPVPTRKKFNKNMTKNEIIQSKIQKPKRLQTCHQRGPQRRKRRRSLRKQIPQAQTIHQTTNSRSRLHQSSRILRPIRARR